MLLESWGIANIQNDLFPIRGFMCYNRDLIQKFRNVKGDQMAITISQLCKYSREDYAMEIVCGEKNMSNIVEWVHMLEDPEAAHFLHGRELIFTTGIGMGEGNWFIEFVEGLMERDASGWVLNIGPYIKEVPKSLIDYCREKEFPLFVMPWETRIVDVTHEFCHRIIHTEEVELNVASAFQEIIVSPDKLQEVRPILEKELFKLDGEYSVMSIYLKVRNENEFLAFEKRVRLAVTRILLKHSDRFSIFLQDKSMIVIMQEFPEHFVKEAFNRLLQLIPAKGRENHLHAGISGMDYGVLSLARSHKRALAVMRIAEKQGKDWMAYADSGVYQLLIEVDDRKVLKKFYDKSLGRLLDYDVKNGTDLLEVLRLYLAYNHSVEKVAQEVFVHRNTVNYKMKKIKEILDTDLTYEDGVKLLMAYHIKEFL